MAAEIIWISTVDSDVDRIADQGGKTLYDIVTRLLYFRISMICEICLGLKAKLADREAVPDVANLKRHQLGFLFRRDLLHSMLA